MKCKIELGSFSMMTKYADRGLNLAVFFLKQGIPQMRISEAEMGLILVLYRGGKKC